MSPVRTALAFDTSPKFVCVSEHKTAGERIEARRLAIGMSVRQLAKRASVDRDTAAKAEANEQGVRTTTYAKLEAALDVLEEELGMDTPDIVTSTIEMPDGTRVMFVGKADGVAEAAAKYIRERGL